jgi:hypothetical protein
LIFADANWAEKPSFDSTSGVFLCLSGRNTFFPLAAASEKQTAKSHSTPEAEIVAADFALRSVGLPSLQLWDTVLGKGKRVLKAIFKEDNQSAIKIMTTGKNPTMRHMQRTHGLSIAWIKEQFDRNGYVLDYCPTLEMSADIFTKGFTERHKWTHARKLIAHFMPDEIGLGVTKVNGVINPLAQVEGGESHKSYNRIIIEYCCSPTSKIGIYTTWSKRCLVIRITETLDATKQSTLDFILH